MDTIRSATRERFEIIPDGQPKVVMSTLQQARHCHIQVVNALERDPQLVEASGLCSRESFEPILIDLPTLLKQTAKVAELWLISMHMGTPG
ncbi:hypothetical protein DFQ15_1191 [Xylophilus ampelinus]|uniref:Uncharacterized protein n=1 Tax=Xylophilus ampelinus TaxID=54067 RepID=A0A318SIM0_9BURK|nr:hypothetical protein DFQ15_1191 [Xylophilus ampelinus]